MNYVWFFLSYVIDKHKQRNINKDANMCDILLLRQIIL